MPKANGKRKDAPEPSIPRTKALYTIEPWSCRRLQNGEVVAIEAYVEAAGDWQTVAEVRQTAHIDADITAHFIVKAVNDFSHNQKLIDELVIALELCLKCKLTWEAEHEAEIMVRRARNK